MPLEKGAKPGTKGFGKNVAAEKKAGKPTKQAVAIAYSVAKDAAARTGKRVRVSKDAKGGVHVFLPGRSVANYGGVARTLLRSHDRQVRRNAKDMSKENFAELKRLLVEFLGEEEREPEHAKDCAGHKDCGCGCKH